MALNSLFCADVPLSNYSLTPLVKSRTFSSTSIIMPEIFQANGHPVTCGLTVTIRIFGASD